MSKKRMDRAQVMNDASAETPLTPPQREIEPYRRCPLCWNRCRGYGTAYSKQGRIRYYKCNQTLTDLPPCGHTWTATVKIEVVKVEHRAVEIEER